MRRTHRENKLVSSLKTSESIKLIEPESRSFSSSFAQPPRTSVTFQHGSDMEAKLDMNCRTKDCPSMGSQREDTRHSHLADTRLKSDNIFNTTYAPSMNGSLRLQSKEPNPIPVGSPIRKTARDEELNQHHILTRKCNLSLQTHGNASATRYLANGQSFCPLAKFPGVSRQHSYIVQEPFN